MLPLQSVRTVSTEEGETLTVVYVKGDRPDNVVENIMADETIPEGFWPVAVEIGISDNYNVEIKSGVEEGTEVFTQIQTANPCFHRAHCHGAPLVQVYHGPYLDGTDVPLVHGGVDHQGGGVGDGDHRGVGGDFVSGLHRKANDLARDGGHGGAVGQVLLGGFQGLLTAPAI